MEKKFSGNICVVEGSRMDRLAKIGSQFNLFGIGSIKAVRVKSHLCVNNFAQ
jgi:hypothetical protein